LLAISSWTFYHSQHQGKNLLMKEKHELRLQMQNIKAASHGMVIIRIMLIISKANSFNIAAKIPLKTTRTIQCMVNWIIIHKRPTAPVLRWLHQNNDVPPSLKDKKKHIEISTNKYCSKNKQWIALIFVKILQLKIMYINEC
jgi:hypothetical protein